MTVYKLFWDEFASWYLEIIKPAPGEPIDNRTMNATIDIFEITAENAASFHALYHRGDLATA